MFGRRGPLAVRANRTGAQTWLACQWSTVHRDGLLTYLSRTYNGLAYLPDRINKLGISFHKCSGARRCPELPSISHWQKRTVIWHDAVGALLISMYLVFWPAAPL